MLYTLEKFGIKIWLKFPIARSTRESVRDRDFFGDFHERNTHRSFIQSIFHGKALSPCLEKRWSEEKRFDERLTYEQYRCMDLVIYIKLYCLPSVETSLIVLQDDNRICRSRNSRSVLDPSPSLTLLLLSSFRPLLHSTGMPRDRDL